ncbi:MAG TPA: hypothetical protein VHU18_12530 [Rhizomicrobium sp.]|jgi:hypothetical protein|nr:hypothetical protein [Rhizomicrobium sp.]
MSSVRLSSVLIAIVASVTAQAATAAAQIDAKCVYSGGDATRRKLTFSEYPAPKTAGRKSAPIHLERNTGAWEFRTVLREGYRRGEPDFADHYRIEMWGCGANCVAYAVADVFTGRVYFAPFPRPGETDFQTYGFVDYRPDSRLLIALGPMQDDNSNLGVVYYLWNGKRFDRIAAFPDAVCK